MSTDYRAAAFLTVISYGVAAILSFFITEVKGKEKTKICLQEFKSVLCQTVSNKSIMIFLIAVAFMTQIHQTITVFLNQIQYEKCGLSASSMGFVFIVITLVGMLGVFSDKFTRKKGIKFAGASIFITAFLTCFILAITNSALLSVCCVLLLNLSNSLFQPLQMEEQNKQVMSNNRATELSIYAMIIDSICAGTSAMFGMLAKVTLEQAFVFGAMLSLVGLLLFMIWYKKQRKLM